MKRTAVFTAVAVLILAFAMLLCVSPASDKNMTVGAPPDDTLWSDDTDTDWYYASPAAPSFTISNERELAGLAKIVNDGVTNFNTKTINVSALTLDLSAHYWVPIGTSSTTFFDGIFDGNGVEISGLYIGKPSSYYTDSYGCGLFGWTQSNSTITEISIVDSAIYGESGSGSIAAITYGQISYCYNMGSVSSSGSNAYAGGIVSSIMGSGKIFECYNKGPIYSSNNAGGIAGEHRGDEISNCYNTGEITVGDVCGGGIVGISVGKISNCYNTGAVHGRNVVSGRELGGIAGSSGGLISNCYNTGTISGLHTVGGITGWMRSAPSTIDRCYNVGVVSGENLCGPIAGDLGAGTISNSYWPTALGFPDGLDASQMSGIWANFHMTGLSSTYWYFPTSDRNVYFDDYYRMDCPQLKVFSESLNDTKKEDSATSAKITLLKKKAEIIQTGTYDYVQGQKLSAIHPMETAPRGIPGTFAWKDGSEILSTTGTLTKKMIFAPDDLIYTVTEFDVTITVTSNVPAIASPGTYTYVVGEKVSDNVPMETAPTGIFGVFAWKNGNEVLQTIGSTTKVMVFTPNDPRYQQVEYDVSVVVTDGLDVPSITATGVYYYARGETLSARVPTEIAPPGIPGTFMWQNGNDVVAMGDTKKPMVFMPSDFRYKPLVFDADITVVDGLGVPSITQTGTYEYIRDEKLSANVPTEITPPGIPGTFMWQNGNQVVKLGDTTKPMVFIPNDPRYNPVTFNVTISVIGLPVPAIKQTGVYSYIQGEKVSANIPSESSPAGVPGTFSWYNGNEIVMIGDTTKKMVFTPNDARYVPITFNVTITVTGGLSVPSITSTGTYRYVEGERLSVINPSERSPAGIPGTFTWENGGDILELTDKSKKMVFTPNDFRYTPITFDVAVIVSEAPEPDNTMLTLLIGCLISAVIGAVVAVGVVMIARKH